MASLTLENVSFSYEEGKPILDGLSLEIADGERHAILGASGAGKTTLLNVLSGLLTPTSGRILFDTDDVTHEPAAARSLTQVFQFPVLYEALTVQENLEFALRNHGDFDTEADNRIREIVDELGLVDALTKKSKQLSLTIIIKVWRINLIIGMITCPNRHQHCKNQNQVNDPSF